MSEPRKRGRGRGRGLLPRRTNQNAAIGRSDCELNRNLDISCNSKQDHQSPDQLLQRPSSSSSSLKLPEAIHTDEEIGRETRPSVSDTPEHKTKPENSNPGYSGLQSPSNVSDAVDLPVRPAFGSLGRPIKLISNCFPIKVPNGYVYHYDVEIRQNTSSGTETAGNKKYRCLNTRTKRKAVSLMLETNKFFSDSYAAYDGKRNLYTRNELKVDFPLRCQIILPDENPINPADPRTDVYEVEIKPVEKKGTLSCAINLDSIHDLFDQRTTTVPQEAIMAVETILRHGPCLRFTPIGRSFFFPPSPHDLHPIGGGLEIWFGYHQSVRLGQWKPTVNLDTTATTFLRACPVLDFIAENLNINIQDMQGVSLNNTNIKILNRKLKDREIKVTHLRYPRRHKIVKLIRDGPNQKYIDFRVKGGTERISVTQYFERHHKRNLKYPNLPCLQVTPENRNIYLPIEVCEFTPGQHNKSELSSAQKSKMIEFTSVPPVERFRKIDNIVKKVNFNADKCAHGFEVEVSPRPLDVVGRIIDAPSVVYRDERQIRPQNGSWNLRDHRFVSGAKISRSVLLNFSRIPLPTLKRFSELFVDIGSKLGMEINGFPRIRMAEMNWDKKELLSEVKENADLVIIVIPTMEEWQENTFYREIKRTAETVVGMTTQCIKENTVRAVNGKRGPQIVNNLCLKINVKRYGENNSLAISHLPDILRKPVIVLGADVNHPAPTALDKISLAACVGSLDSFCKRCAASVRAQVNPRTEKKRLEIIVHLESMVKELLIAFYRHTGKKKPEKIIFYRDGVSEGEFSDLKKNEVVSIRKACKSLQDDYEPGITFIVVQKRHHVRFRPQDPREGFGRTQNVPSGTVIDTTVTHPVNFDFFLCSQQGLQGTSRPSHYVVLEDDNEFSADDLQKMTFQLCHMYARCTKSISIPAPVAYADLVAYRARKHLEAKMAEDVSSSGSEYSMTAEDEDAVKVLDALKNSMYFV